MCLPYKNCAFTLPPVHLPSISSSLSRFIPPSQTHTPKMKCHLHVSFIRPLSSTPSLVPVFHFGGFCRFFPSSVFVCLSCALLLSCIKKKLFFLVSVRQSVCLSVFVRVAVFPAVWPQVESEVTQWATSSGGIRGVKPFPSLPKDLTGGVLYCCLFSTRSLCLCVSLCH